MIVKMIFFNELSIFDDCNVIFLWMLLNYDVFAIRPTEKFLKSCKEKDLHSGFPDLVGSKLKYYKRNLQTYVNTFPPVKEQMWPGEGMPEMLHF